ncbi:protein TolR [Methylobacterium isbiliense]|jgi:biopolymer transport protein TolR|uniref:Biopolymer transport protein ExbD n=1 Tax=Methylobacterium isbiliense TaxID=315478 RepID=A0ABQ4SI01_9HYPH|nr:protein TolR [Methylobacterium isbiliense]MDN3624321.1 protein TolR [Methylobacterium isbiliense]GJE01404.1 Biopolymer transport protein ExbD [Methylobacterium isbiliense]
MGMGPLQTGAGDEDDFDAAPLSEINVTPMVDVMLVLLIIFMVAAPLMTVGVPVQLPKTAAAKTSENKKPVVVSVDKDGHAFLAKEALPPEGALARLKAVAAEDPGQTVLVRGDKDVPYGKVMEVMGLVGQAGFAKVSLIANAPGGAALPPPSPR